MSSKRTRSFGVSAITVVAAFSMSAGCEDSESPSNPQVDGGADGGPKADGGPTSCPPQAPAKDDVCSFVGNCIYESCNIAPNATPTLQAICRDGKVVVLRASCNPPPPKRDAGPTDAAVDGSTALQGIDGG